MAMSSAERVARSVMLRSLLPVISVGLLHACAGVDPGEELQAVVAAAEAAAEERDTGHFRRLVSSDYVDASGRRKQDLIDFLRLYFVANADIEVLTRVENVEIFGDDAAELTLQSALLGRGQGRSAFGVDGDLYRIDLELVRESGDWRIIGADWERILQ
jgi:hypothetical protein